MDSLCSPASPCRCGHDGAGVHRCHYGREGADRCPEAGVERLVATAASLAGMQLKFGATLGCYCPTHWDEYRQEVALAAVAREVLRG